MEATNRTAFETINLLQYRLRRIEFLLTGYDEGQEQSDRLNIHTRDDTLATRLAKIESNLARLASQLPAVNDLLTLHAAFPDLFHAVGPNQIPTTLSPPELLATINSNATSYPTTASRLTSVKDLPVPSAESSAALIDLQPRIARVQLLQESQGRELAALRHRSASLIKRWYELSVLGASECWTEWEKRMTAVEKQVRRQEGRIARDVKTEEAYAS
ncbi:MAG: hypothetical protein Q9191_005005 [Dirinaria sp. TL-2023a]